MLGTGAAATAMLGESTDAVLVGSVTVGNALLSGVQRLRAETALESLLLEQDVSRPPRDRRRARGGAGAAPCASATSCSSSPATSCAADARLLEASDLEVDESNLTGESLSVAKSVAATPGADVADRTCMLFDGTTVVAGTRPRRRRGRRRRDPGRTGRAAAGRRRAARPGCRRGSAS